MLVASVSRLRCQCVPKVVRTNTTDSQQFKPRLKSLPTRDRIKFLSLQPPDASLRPLQSIRAEISHDFAMKIDQIYPKMSPQNLPQWITIVVLFYVKSRAENFSRIQNFNPSLTVLLRLWRRCGLLGVLLCRGCCLLAVFFPLHACHVLYCVVFGWVEYSSPSLYPLHCAEDCVKHVEQGDIHTPPHTGLTRHNLISI